MFEPQCLTVSGLGASHGGAWSRLRFFPRSSLLDRELSMQIHSGSHTGKGIFIPQRARLRFRCRPAVPVLRLVSKGCTYAGYCQLGEDFDLEIFVNGELVGWLAAPKLNGLDLISQIIL